MIIIVITLLKIHIAPNTLVLNKVPSEPQLEECNLCPITTLVWILIFTKILQENQKKRNTLGLPSAIKSSLTCIDEKQLHHFVETGRQNTMKDNINSGSSHLQCSEQRLSFYFTPPFFVKSAV